LPPTAVQAPVGGAEGALPFSGGNANNLAHPPFTFGSVEFEEGRLEAVGYSKGRQVARDVVFTPQWPDHITLRVSDEGVPLQADGSDFVFVYATACDRNGQVVPSFKGTVRLRVGGMAKVLSFSERNAVAGIAPFLVVGTTMPGQVHVTAQSSGLKPGELNFRTDMRW
jgi:beta-galactosidase